MTKVIKEINTQLNPLDLYSKLTQDMLDRADASSIGGTDVYLRTRQNVVGMIQRGEIKQAYLTIQNFYNDNNLNLKESVNLEKSKIFRILAEQETPVITKAEILKLLKK